MKRIIALALALGLMAGSPALAAQDTDAQAAALRLLDAMDMETMLVQGVDISLDAQLKQNPELGPYREIIRSFLARHMSYGALRLKLSEIYASELSAEDLDAAAEFYRTPAGRNIMEKMPSLMTQGMELGQKSVQDHLPELQEAIREEAERLQDLSTQKASE